MPGRMMRSITTVAVTRIRSVHACHCFFWNKKICWNLILEVIRIKTNLRVNQSSKNLSIDTKKRYVCLELWEGLVAQVSENLDDKQDQKRNRHELAERQQTMMRVFNEALFDSMYECQNQDIEKPVRLKTPTENENIFDEPWQNCLRIKFWNFVRRLGFKFNFEFNVKNKTY